MDKIEEILRNDEITAKAKSVYLFIYIFEDKKVNTGMLMQNFKEKKDALYLILRELQRLKFITFRQSRTKGAQFSKGYWKCI